MHSIQHVLSNSPESANREHRITWELPWALLIRVLREEIPFSELRSAIRAMTVEAHRRDLSAEQFVITVKRDLLATAELGLATYSAAQREVVDRLVSLCISEYYRAD